MMNQKILLINNRFLNNTKEQCQLCNILNLTEFNSYDSFFESVGMDDEQLEKV